MSEGEKENKTNSNTSIEQKNSKYFFYRSVLFYHYSVLDHVIETRICDFTGTLSAKAMAADDIYNFNAELEDGGIFPNFNHYESRMYSQRCVFSDKKTTKGKRKSIRMSDIADIQIKKEFGCDNCDRSFTSLAVIF